MQIRTDLALELTENISKNIYGVQSTKKNIANTTITSIKIKTKEAGKKLSKMPGDYITVELPKLTQSFNYTDKRIKIISDEIKNFIPKKGLVLVVGLGNSNITPDALGPICAEKILATRHILKETFKKTGLNLLRPVAVFVPGVLGQTGIESAELILSVTKKLHPDLVILIDALASRSLNRLGSTVQISNTGISPGSGVGNKRPGINKSTLGVPVLSIGVPTVVDAVTLSNDVMYELNKDFNCTKSNINTNCKEMMVTPREIDVLIKSAGLLVSMAINCALQPTLSAEDLFLLVN